jgi:hypothetical protein
MGRLAQSGARRLEARKINRLRARGVSCLMWVHRIGSVARARGQWLSWFVGWLVQVMDQ